MITTIDRMITAKDVLEITGYTADSKDIALAQAIVEVFAGKPMASVENVVDLEWMKRAIAWQVAYMSEDPQAVYEQANISTIQQNGIYINLGTKHYQIAPLAERAIRLLTWVRSRSIKTRPMYGRVVLLGWEYA